MEKRERANAHQSLNAKKIPGEKSNFSSRKQFFFSNERTSKRFFNVVHILIFILQRVQNLYTFAILF